MSKLITLDFEGTLVNFQWKLEEAQKEVLNLLVEKGISREIFDNTNYDAIYNLVQEKGEEWGFPAGYLTSLLDDVYDIYDLDAASRWNVRDGVHAVLEQLKEYKTALISNVGRKGLLKALVQHGLQDKFGIILSRNDMRLLKPASEGLLRIIEWAQVKKEDTIHIGDSLSDLFAARNTGIKVGIVLGGQNTPEALLGEKPDLVMKKITELPSALKTINF
jgi:phosphoglycolate phosphatase